MGENEFNYDRCLYRKQNLRREGDKDFCCEESARGDAKGGWKYDLCGFEGVDYRECSNFPDCW